MAIKKISKGENFFSKLIAKLFKSNDPEAEKKRQLKIIAKEIARSKYKFIKPASSEVTPQFAKFFYDIYKNIAPAQAIIRGIQNPNAIKNRIMIVAMTPKQIDLFEKISEDYILEQAESVPFEKLAEETKNNLETFSREFDSEKIQEVDKAYNQIEIFKSFCTYDFFFLLKKFDSSMQESTFSVTPKFDTIRGEYVVEDIKDFIDILYCLPVEADWAFVMKIFKELKGVEPVALNTWNKILSRLKDIRTSGILEAMLRILLQDPFYKQESTQETKYLFESYIDKIKTQTNLALKKIETEKRTSKVNDLAVQLFGSTTVLRLKNYTEANNAPFERKMMGGYLYYQPLDYMKAFLTDFFKKDVREFADLVLIRGKWTTSVLSKQLSDTYNSILAIAEELNNFDASLGEDSERGAKLKNFLVRCDKDSEAAKILRTQLKDINEAAFDMLTRASQYLVQFAKDARSLLEDKEKPSPQMIINWKELEHFADVPIREMGVSIYKQIAQFAQLMQILLKK
ncbi:MAG: hypothetical protein ACTTHG_03160 [Treponemataceae bacterium]